MQFFPTHKLIFLSALAFFFAGSACVEPIHPYSAIAPGEWRAVLYIDPNKSITPGIQDRSGERQNLHEQNDIGILPFVFDVKYTNDTSWYIEIHNGEERIPIRDISLGRTRSEASPTLKMEFDIYDSHIEALVKEDIMQGHFVVRAKENYRIPFAAFHGKEGRFIRSVDIENRSDFNGRWEVIFSPDTEDEYRAIGEFKQEGHLVTGTFLTETGDYRYLEGIAEGNKLWLSVFDGAHAFLFHAKENADGSIQGIFRSGKHYQTSWIGNRNNKVKLKSPDSLSQAIVEQFSLTLPDHEGVETSFPAPDLNGIKILQIMGTWCPNCKDETEFLIEYLNNNPDLPLHIVSVAFERYSQKELALASLARYKDKLNIPYPIFYGGLSKKSAASEILPMLDKVISYPTMVFLDKNNRVRRVHTGFAGPATSEYEDFVNDFDEFVKSLASE